MTPEFRIINFKGKGFFRGCKNPFVGTEFTGGAPPLKNFKAGTPHHFLSQRSFQTPVDIEHPVRGYVEEVNVPIDSFQNFF
jgi:hypothetical protein